MKAMKKALALGLALAMVVTAVPVTNAQAATTGVAKSKTYAAGKSYTLKLTTPSTWKSVKTTWSTSNKSVASLSSSKAKSVKVKAVKKGTATVKAKVTFKKSNKSYTRSYQCKVTVKNPGVRMNAEAAVAVGQKVSVKSPKAWPTTATVTYASDKTDIATVDAKTGEVTGVKAGEATITATLVCGTITKTNSTKVTVKNVVLQSVKQTRWDTIEAVIVGNTKSLKNEDILITCKDTNVVCRVKSIAIDANDSTKVTATIYGTMTDGKNYTVKVDGVEKEFVASDNVVADVVVTPLQIVAGDIGTKIVGHTVDKNGVILSDVLISNSGTNGVDFNVKVNATDGYTREDQLVLFKAGNKATAEITYHTYKYENGTETGAITKSYEIVAVDATTTISGFNYTIVRAGTTPNWSSAKTQIPVEDTDMYAWFRFVDSNGTDVTENYTVETSDRTVLMVADGAAAKANLLGIHVVGIKQGSAYINVKDARGNIVASLPVTVVPARKLARVQLGSSNIVVSNQDLTDASLTSLAGYETVTQVNVPVYVFDQYGDILPNVTTTSTALYNAPDSLVSTTTPGSIIVDANGQSAGAHQYRLDVRDTRGTHQVYSFAVRVVTPTPVGQAGLTDVQKRRRENYRLVVTPATYDVAITGDTKETKKNDVIDVKIGVYENGALIAYLPISNPKWNCPSVNVTSASALSTAMKIFDNSNSKTVYKALATGTYRVEAYTDLNLNGTVESVRFYDDIAITDSLNGEGAVVTTWSVSRFTSSVSVNKGMPDANIETAAVEAISQCLTVSCMGESVVNDIDKIYVNADDVIVTNNALFIKKAYFITTIGSTNFAVPFTVNMTFTVK